MRISWRRVWAIILQQSYIVKRSPIRVFELFYWPILSLVVWGYIAIYLRKIDTDIPGGVAVLLGAVVLWDVLFRSQQELNVSGLMDHWERNVLNLYASPLTQAEHFLGLLLFSTARVLLGSIVLVTVAWLAFDFNVLDAGRVLLPAFVILTAMGWSLGLLIRGAVLRFGSNAEVLAWSLVVLVQPVAAVFYPVTVLPPFLQSVAQLVPAAHVFEAMRAFLATGEVLGGRLVLAAVLDLIYLAIGAAVLAAAFRAVRVKGLLSRPGY